MTDPSTSEITESMTVEEVVARRLFDPQEFSNPLVMIATYHNAMQAGHIGPYQWQAEVNEQLATEGYSKSKPLKYYLVAANGSGKDAYVISPFAVWFIFTKIRSRVVITSSSHSQLKNQTENYIRTWCNMINAAHMNDPRGKPFILKQQFIQCRWTGGEITLFATDEEGKAEGYHPFADYPNGELSVIINEGKSVKDDIYLALNRCTYSHWIVVSSPGADVGNLYASYRKATKWPEALPSKTGAKYARKVTAYECPHIGKEKLDAEAEEMGRAHPWFRSARLADFTSQDESTILTMDALRSCQENCRTHIPYGLRAGLDLALGGDETTFYCFDGNKFKMSERWKMKDSNATVHYCIEVFKKAGFSKSMSKNIFADHGGLGAGLKALFEEHGWQLTWVVNQSKALRRNSFCANRGAELWMSFRSIVEHNLVSLPTEEDDPKLWDQLSSRYYKQHATTGKLVLEAKADAKAKGHGSPDRADAVVLSFCGLTHETIEEKGRELASGGQIKPVVKRKRSQGQAIDVNSLAKDYDEFKYARAFPDNRKDPSTKLATKRTAYSIIAGGRSQIDPSSQSLFDKVFKQSWKNETYQTTRKRKSISQLYTDSGKLK